MNGLAIKVLYRESVQNEGNSAIYWAAEHGHTNTLEKVRSCGAELNDNSGSHLPIVIRRHATKPVPMISCGFGFFPLHVAAKFGQDAGLEWLLRNGARIDSLASGLCQCQASLTETANDSIDSLWTPRWTPLHVAICNSNISTARLLISRGASVLNQPGPRTCINVLHTASRCNNITAIEFLVGSGLVDVDEPDSQNYTALHYACSRLDNLPALNTLIKHGASLHASSRHQTDLSPVALACEQGFFEGALELVNRGAIHDIEGSSGNDLLQIASEPFQSFFGLPTSLVPEIWVKQREDFIRRLVEHGVDVDGRDSSTRTPLARAAAQDQSLPRTLQHFLEIGADVNAMDGSTKNPIYLVLERGDFGAITASKVKLLLRCGARLDLYSDNGYCAFDRVLSMAQLIGWAFVIDFIFKHGSVANFGHEYLNRILAHPYVYGIYKERRLTTDHSAVFNVSGQEFEVRRDQSAVISRNNILATAEDATTT